MKKKYILLAVITVLAVTSYAQDIVQWRGPNRDGIYPEKNLLTQWPENGPKLLWKYDNLGLGYKLSCSNLQ